MHCERDNDQGADWPWPELLDDSALWTVQAPLSDPKRIEKLQREQEGLRWNG